MRDGTEVAVKELPLNAKQAVDDFINEVQLVHSLQHKNLVKLRGCSVSGRSRVLVYEYVENKSLAQALFGKWQRTFLMVQAPHSFIYFKPFGNAPMWSYWWSCDQYHGRRNSKMKRFCWLRATFWTQGLYTRFRVQDMRKWSGGNVAITFPPNLDSPHLRKMSITVSRTHPTAFKCCNITQYWNEFDFGIKEWNKCWSLVGIMRWENLCIPQVITWVNIIVVSYEY